MATGRYRPRKQFKFWLYTDLQSEEWLAEVIGLWKSKRQFSEIVKNGLRLMFSLGQGHTDVLFELFPQLETQLTAKYAPPPTPDNSELQRQIADLKMIILQQGNIQAPPKDYPQSKSVGGHVAAPVATLTAAKPATADEICDNFMSFIQ